MQFVSTKNAKVDIESQFGLIWFSLKVNSHVLKVSETNTTSLQGINVPFFGENWLQKLITYNFCDFLFVTIHALFRKIFGAKMVRRKFVGILQVWLDPQP